MGLCGSGGPVGGFRKEVTYDFGGPRMTANFFWRKLFEHPRARQDSCLDFSDKVSREEIGKRFYRNLVRAGVLAWVLQSPSNPQNCRKNAKILEKGTFLFRRNSGMHQTLVQKRAEGASLSTTFLRMTLLKKNNSPKTKVANETELCVGQKRGWEFLGCLPRVVRQRAAPIF